MKRLKLLRTILLVSLATTLVACSCNPIQTEIQCEAIKPELNNIVKKSDGVFIPKDDLSLLLGYIYQLEAGCEPR